jgi:quinol monooxygenase YgiN
MIANYGFHATMSAQPGKGDALVELLLSGTTTGPAAHDDCLVFLVSRSASNPDVVHLTEGWTSEEAHDRVFTTDEAQVHIARFGELVDGETQYVDEVPVGGKALLTPARQRDEEVKG